MQQIRCVTSQTLVEILSGHVGDRTGNLTFRLRTVTHYDYLIQFLSVLFQVYIDLVFAAYRLQLCHVTDIGELKGRVWGYFHNVFTIQICNRAVGRAFLDYVSTDNSVSFRVFNDTGDAFLSLLGNNVFIKYIAEFKLQMQRNSY